jgi:Ca2+-binding RTX toxin-like protein
LTDSNNVDDTVSYDRARRGVTVDLAAGTGVLTGSNGPQNQLPPGIVVLAGSRFDDTLRGDDQENLVYSGRGADRVAGRAGAMNSVRYGAVTTSPEAREVICCMALR